MSGDDPIVVTPHATARVRQRFSGWPTSDGGVDRSLYGAICAEVGDALRAGRRAKTMPRWVAIRRRSKAQSGNGTRPRWFVWNEEQTRCYVIQRDRTVNFSDGWVVVTALSPNDPDA